MSLQAIMQGKSVPSLIEEFERDILHNAHPYTARFERSSARKELNRRRREALAPIAKHLRENPPSTFNDLNIAWAHLLCWTEVNVDRDKTGPKSLEDIEGWIQWAEKFAV